MPPNSPVGSQKSKSLRSQLRKVNPKIGKEEGSSLATVVSDVKFSLTEGPVDVLLTLYPLALAIVLEAVPVAAVFVTPLIASVFTLVLGASCGFPWKYNIFCCHPGYLISVLFLLFILFPRKSDGTLYPLHDTSSSIFMDYVKQMILAGLVVCFFGVFLFTFPSYLFRKRVSIRVAIIMAFWASFVTAVMFCGILVFQWFFVSSGRLTGAEEFFIVGIAYPLFGASVGRAMFSDWFATTNALLFCDKSTTDFMETSQAVHVRMLWVICNRVCLCFAGSVSVINLQSHASFGLAMLSSTAIEIIFTFAWFYASLNVLPKLIKGILYRKTQVVKPISSVESDTVDGTKGSNTTEQLAIPKTFGGLIYLWTKLFTDKETLPLRFTLNRSYEERSERVVTLAATGMLLVCGSTNMDRANIAARGLTAYLIEVFVIDPFKTFIQHRVIGLIVVRRTHTIYEYAALCSSMGISIALIFVTRHYFNEHELPIAF